MTQKEMQQQRNKETREFIAKTKRPQGASLDDFAKFMGIEIVHM